MNSLNIQIPGSFVYLQGMPGDGLCNTIDTLPRIGRTAHDDDPQNPFVTDILTRDSLQAPTGGAPNLWDRYKASVSLPAAQALEDESVLVSEDEDPQIPLQERYERSTCGQRMSTSDAKCIQEWSIECRKREEFARGEWMETSLQRGSTTNVDTWWTVDGKLAVFDSLPCTMNENTYYHLNQPVAILDPGCTVIATDMVTMDTETLQRIQVTSTFDQNNTRKYPPGRKGWIQMVKIESPAKGFVVLSIDGYAFLAPGLPCQFLDPSIYWWRVTCAVGAVVREGLELSTRHVHTIPYGSLLQVTQKVINNMGLSRLKVRAVVENHDDSQQMIEGWCSEYLNPLSGQRGSIAQPVPFPFPALYRIKLSTGAVIRSDIELSSRQICHAPLGTIVAVTGRVFSEHPTHNCIERLRLAGGGGWISVRLNTPDSRGVMLVEPLGLDLTFNPNNPGSYHINAIRDAHAKLATQRPTVCVNNTSYKSSDLNDMHSMNDSDDEASADSLASCHVLQSENSVSPRYTSSSSRRRNKGQRRDNHCLICLCEERNATLVHGETGHVACCLICARILKARGDPCPVCRLPIDLVIQHFWA